MVTPAETVRKLITAHLQGEESAFRKAAEEYVEEERRKNHHVVANELERLLTNTNSTSIPRSEVLSLLGMTNGSVPKDKDRDVVLVDVSDPRRDLSSLVLSDDVRSSIERLVNERRGADLLGTYGIRAASKLLFCGPPGCGKTAAAEAVAKELYLPLATVRFDAVVSSYLGETASNLRKVFDFARSRPMVLLFDEFDAIGKHRTAEDEHGELKRVVNSFLQLLDSFRSDTLTIAATNHQGLLDAALWRRFDDIILFPKPDARQILELLSRLLRQLGVSQEVRLELAAKALLGMSHADVERVATDAIKQTILTGRNEIGSDILMGAIERQRVRNQVTEEGLPGDALELRSKSSRREPK